MAKQRFTVCKINLVDTAAGAEAVEYTLGTDITATTNKVKTVDAIPVGVISEKTPGTGTDDSKLFGGFSYPNTEYVFTVDGTDSNSKIELDGVEYTGSDADIPKITEGLLDIYKKLESVSGSEDGGLV